MESFLEFLNVVMKLIVITPFLLLLFAWLRLLIYGTSQLFKQEKTPKDKVC